MKPVSGDPKPTAPVVLGYDCSGVVEAIGVGTVTDLKVGDACFGVSTSGALASHRKVVASMFVAKPAELTHGEAASLITAGITAMQMLDWATEHAAVDKILITGGASGTGTMALQLAKNCFNVKTVVTTASAHKVGLMKELGADDVIDYHTADFVEVLGPASCDAALDIIGEDKNCTKVTKKAGKHSMVATVALRIPSGQMVRDICAAYHTPLMPGCVLGLLNCLSSKTIHSMVMLPWKRDLERIAKFAVDGKVKVHVDRIYPFDQCIAALDYVEEGHVTGKCIVEVVEGATAGLVEHNPLK